jgi:RsiW-degrading membrane proteinase PrsW (M82 family)
VDFLKSWFSYPGIGWYMILAGFGIAVVFGAIWLLGYKPPLIKKPGLWVVAIVSAFLTMLAIAFVQIPLRYYYGQAIESTLSQDTILNLLLLVGIPMVLINGLVQEGAKMIPMVFWWRRNGKKLDPKMGLIIGALAGAGFGVFEAVWLHNQLFMAGWTWDAVNYNAWQGLLPFWDQFWWIALHIAVSALVGYGLAKGKGWQFYLLASVLHGLVSYLNILYNKGMLTYDQVEIIMAAVAALVMLAALWLRWQKEKEEPQIGLTEPAVPIEPAGPAEIDI